MQTEKLPRAIRYCSNAATMVVKRVMQQVDGKWLVGQESYKRTMGGG